MTDDWMTPEHKAAALEGFMGNEVAKAYARAVAESEREPSLAAWLLEQIAEDEAEARDPEWWDARQATRMLAECEAKRKIVALHPVAAFPDLESIYDDAGVFQTQRPTGGTVYSCPVCDDYYDGGTESHSQPGCPTLRALALPYADREGYRQEWKP